MFFHDHNATHLSDVFNLLSGPFFLLFHEVMLKKTQWSNESKMSGASNSYEIRHFQK